MSWHLGPAIVSCNRSYNHLGIIINEKGKLSDRIQEACNKGRRSYIALSDLGSPFLNPRTLTHLQIKQMCESYFDVLPICAELDVRKLLFLGRLCRLNPKMLTKNIFLTRLFSYFHDLSTNQLRFIPDIMSILQSYDLTDHLWTFLDDVFFPENLPGEKLYVTK